MSKYMQFVAAANSKMKFW